MAIGVGMQRGAVRCNGKSGSDEGRGGGYFSFCHSERSEESRGYAQQASPLADAVGALASALAYLPDLRRKHDLASAGRVLQRRRMDKFEEIFRMQNALNQRIGVNLPPPTDEEKTKWILNYTRAMQQETAELIDSVPWKWWAKYQKFDEQNAKVEVVDLFHFLVSLAQTLGMTADDVYQAYLKKNQVNHQRQDSGYVKKDEADSKHI